VNADGLSAQVAQILADVRERGDEAVLDYTERFDSAELGPAGLRVDPVEIEAAIGVLEPAVRDALQTAIANVKAVAKAQLRDPLPVDLPEGQRVEIAELPVGRAGIYVPGGRAPYPSTVVMGAITAKVAGVGETAVCAPPGPGGAAHPVILAACALCGVTEVYRMGGAQAIAALAYGTESVPPVDVIVGPGNPWVTEAKRQVFGQVGIDMVAGPSEVVVVADRDNDPAWIASDLLAQAEHDEAAQAILITDDADFARKVDAAVEVELAVLPRADTARASWRDFGAIILVKNIDDAPALVDRLAPEHLEIATRDPDALAAKVRDAGAIFIGRYTP
jgi:histidinol dehydrogenase